MRPAFGRPGPSRATFLLYTVLTKVVAVCHFALQEWQYSKVRQDAQLERIEKGVSTLGDMAKGMQVSGSSQRGLQSACTAIHRVRACVSHWNILDCGVALDRLLNVRHQSAVLHAQSSSSMEHHHPSILLHGHCILCLQEELDKQNPVIDEVDDQLNKVTSQLKSNNAKLKGLITQVRSELLCPKLCLSRYVACHVPSQCLVPPGKGPHSLYTSVVLCSEAARTSYQH